MGSCLEELSLSALEIDVVSEIDSKELKKIFSAYRDYIECRFNFYKSDPEVDREKLQLDAVKKEEYVNVLNLLRMVDLNDPFQHCLAYKVVCSVEGVLTARVSSDFSKVHVGCLVTAPWNLEMTSPNFDDKIAMRGVGRSLMQGAYRLNQNPEGGRLCLSPLGQSVSFYTAMGMTEESGEMVLRINSGVTPSPLFSRVTASIRLNSPL